MDDSGKGSAGGPTPPAGPQGQPPIGGMVRDPREIKVNPSLVRFLRERLSAAVIAGLVAIGVLRPRDRERRARPPVMEGPLRLSRDDLRRCVRLDLDPHRAARNRRGAGDPRAPRQAARRGRAPHAAVHDRLLDVDPHAELHDELGREPGPEGQHRHRGLGAGSRRWRGDGERDRALPARPVEGDRRVPQRSAPVTRARSSAPTLVAACARSSRATTS